MTTPQPTEPTPQTWFEDRQTGELFYYLGNDSTPGIGGHVFQTHWESSTRRMSFDMIELKLKPVDPSTPGYQFKAPRDQAFFSRYAQSSAKSTEPASLAAVAETHPYLFHQGPGQKPEHTKVEQKWLKTMQRLNRRAQNIINSSRIPQ